MTESQIKNPFARRPLIGRTPMISNLHRPAHSLNPIPFRDMNTINHSNHSVDYNHNHRSPAMSYFIPNTPITRTRTKRIESESKSGSGSGSIQKTHRSNSKMDRINEDQYEMKEMESIQETTETLIESECDEIYSPFPGTPAISRINAMTTMSAQSRYSLHNSICDSVGNSEADKVDILRSAMRARIRSEVRAEIAKMEKANSLENVHELAPSSLLADFNKVNDTENTDILSAQQTVNEEIEKSKARAMANSVELKVAPSTQWRDWMKRIRDFIFDGRLWWSIFDLFLVYLVFILYLCIVDAQWKS